jgi:hypothetical protein
VIWYEDSAMKAAHGAAVKAGMELAVSRANALAGPSCVREWTWASCWSAGLGERAGGKSTWRIHPSTPRLDACSSRASAPSAVL